MEISVIFEIFIINIFFKLLFVLIFIVFIFYVRYRLSLFIWRCFRLNFNLFLSLAIQAVVTLVVALLLLRRALYRIPLYWFLIFDWFFFGWSFILVFTHRLFFSDCLFYILALAFLSTHTWTFKAIKLKVFIHFRLFRLPSFFFHLLLLFHLIFNLFKVRILLIIILFLHNILSFRLLRCLFYPLCVVFLYSLTCALELWLCLIWLTIFFLDTLLEIFAK